MRKTLFLTVLFLLFNSAFSQIEKGAIQAGGSIRFNYEDNLNTAEYRNFGLYPRAAYFISDNVSFGVSFLWVSQNPVMILLKERIDHLDMVSTRGFISHFQKISFSFYSLQSAL